MTYALAIGLLLLFVPSCGGHIRDNDMNVIALSLFIEGDTFLRSESIPFRVVLRNTSEAPLTLHDFNEENQSITLVAGEPPDARMGTQLSWSLREGESFHEPREATTFELPPGAEAEHSDDALAWLGVLEPGTYTFFATYNAGPNLYVESERISVTIMPATTVAFNPVRANVHLAFVPRLFPHLVQQEGAFDLFLLATSPNDPPNYFRNFKVGRVSAPVAVQASSVVQDPVPFRHLCWLDDAGSLHVIATVPDARRFEREQAYPVQLPGATLLDTPLSDEEGTLHLVAHDPGRKELVYLKVSVEGRVERRALATGVAALVAYAVLWGRTGRLHLLWRQRNDRDLQYLSVQRLGRADPTLRRYRTASDIKGLTLYQPYDADNDSYREHALLLGPDEATGLWGQWEMALPGEVDTLPNEPMTLLPVRASFNLEETALSVDFLPAYLFSEEGHLSVYSTSSGNLLPVRDEAGQQLTPASGAALFMTARFSHKPGTYVGFLGKDATLHFTQVD